MRALRLAAGFSQEELAHSAELHPTYISMVERGIVIERSMLLHASPLRWSCLCPSCSRRPRITKLPIIAKNAREFASLA